MSLDPAALRLTIALRARAASWLPCDVTPGELHKHFDGPPAPLTGRVMRDAFQRRRVIDALEREGIAAHYDRRRCVFELRRIG